MNDLSILREEPSRFIPHMNALDKAAIVAMTDVRGTIIYANSKFCELSGYSYEELIGSNHRIVKSGVHDKEFFRSMYRVIARGEVWHGQLCNRAKDGHLYWVDTTIVPQVAPNGTVVGYTSIRFDISRLKEVEATLWKSANIDSLTGLPNRAALMSRLEDNTQRALAGGEQVVFGLLDIDDFKDINDSFGHSAGDELLQVVGPRLSGLLGQHDTLARLGGDEFALILGGGPDSASEVIHRVLAALREPFQIGGVHRTAHASIGIAVCPRDGATAAQIIKNADIALYQAKSLGGDRAMRFEPAMGLAVQRRAEMRRCADLGLKHTEFELFYQPFLSLKTGRASGAEALLRWHHPADGLLTPGQFQEVFDDAGLCAAVGGFVLARALKQAAEWKASGLPFGKIAVNVTAPDFRTDTYVDRVLQALENGILEPEMLCIEVTENMFLGRSAERIKAGLNRLHAAGVEIALDDFGTGYASLTELADLPITRLKIDKSFVQGIGQRKRATAIVGGLIALAHDLGMEVTAEGVETEDQLAFLRDAQCDDVQGFLMSRPVRAAEAARVIRHL